MVEFESVSWDKLNYQRDDFKLKPVLKYFGTFFFIQFCDQTLGGFIDDFLYILYPFRLFCSD